MRLRKAHKEISAWLAALAVVLCCLPAQAKPHDKRAVRDQIEALEEQWRTAQLGEDVATMDKLLSDDYIGITSAGQVVTKAQQLDRMRTRTLELSRLEITDLKIKLLGQIAIVTSLANIEGNAEGRPLHGSFRYTRVYQRLPGGTWKITNFEATRVPHSHKRAGAVDQDPAGGQGTPSPQG